MENDIALIASGYLLTRIGVLVAIAYLVYRVLRPTRKHQPVQMTSTYAQDRSAVTRQTR